MTLPAGAGYLGVPSVDLIPLLQVPAIDGIVIKPSDNLTVQLEVAVTAAKAITLVAMGGDV